MRTTPEFEVPNRERFDAILELRGELVPDAQIIKQLAVRFEVHENTIRSDLRHFRRLMREHDEQQREDRRAALAHQMATCAQKVRHEALTAEDPKARALNWKTIFDYFRMLVSMYGLSDETQVKTEILKTKLYRESGMTPEQLDEMIRAEVARAVDDMPIEELEKRLAARRGT